MMNNNNKNNQNMNIINLQEVKKNLLSGELVRQIIAVEEIKNTLDLSNDQISRSKLIDDLMKFDITRILYTETLATSSNDLMISILNLAPDLSESKYFFSKEFVQETVDMLLKIGLMINQSKSNKNEKQLRALNRALNTILSGAEASRQQLPKICDIIRLTKYINELNLVDHGFTISATKLTCIVLNYGNTIKDKAEFTEIVKLFEKITNALMEIIDVQKELPNDTIYQRAIELLLIIFYKSAKICRSFKLSEYSEYLLNIMSTISTIIIKNISFYIKTLEITTNISKKILENYINCLCQIYKFEFDGIAEFSEDLATQGYLKHFVKFIPLSKNEFKYKIGYLLSRLLIELSIKHLSADKWIGGIDEFKKFINQSITSSDDLTSRDTLMLLIFFHKSATGENSVEFDLSDTIDMIDHFDKQPVVQPTLLKAIWMLFAELSFVSTTDEVRNLKTNSSLLKLIKMTNKYGIENCYYHNSTIIYFVLINNQFTIDFKMKIIELWLKFEDISALSVHVCRDKILHILLNIIEVHPDKLIVDKSFKEIKELLQLESRKEKTREIIWHKLSNVLMSYTTENENNIKTYLKLVNDLPYKKFSKELLFRCSISLHNIFKNYDLQIETKILVIKQLCEMLKQALKIQDSRVVGIFVDNKKTIQQLFHQANLLDNDDKLSNVCFECLKQIFLNQIVFEEECNDPVIFPLMDIFYSLRNNSTANSAVWFLCFILQEHSICPVVKMQQFKNQTEAKKIISKLIYPAIVTVLERMPSYCYTNIFNCLSEILEFLKRKEYINTLKSCLDYSGNYNVINSAIMAKYYQNDFFIFTEKLISNCVEQMTPMIEFIIDNKMRNLYRKNNENSNSWSIGLPFSKMIVELKKYIDELLLAELIDNKIVNDILKIELLFD